MIRTITSSLLRHCYYVIIITSLLLRHYCYVIITIREMIKPAIIFHFQRKNPIWPWDIHTHGLGPLHRPIKWKLWVADRTKINGASIGFNTAVGVVIMPTVDSMHLMSSGALSTSMPWSTVPVSGYPFLPVCFERKKISKIFISRHVFTISTHFLRNSNTYVI